VAELTASTGAAGITVRFDGTDEALAWLTDALLPALPVEDSAAAGPLLCDRLGFSDSIQHGRRAA